jgi:hypothetical protein
MNINKLNLSERDVKICRARGCLNPVDDTINKSFCPNCSVYLRSVGLL